MKAIEIKSSNRAAKLEHVQYLHVNDIHYRVSVMTREDRRPIGSRRLPKAMRVYVHGTCPEQLGLVDAKPLYTHRGDDPENDKAWKSYNRDEVRVMRAFADRALPDACNALGIDVPIELKYSRKAGCSCGCSPGFIATGGGNERDVWVNVKAT